MFSKPVILSFKQIALISLPPFRSERLIKLINSWLMQVGSLWLPPITFQRCGTPRYIYSAFKKYICKNDLGNCCVRLKYIIKSLVKKNSSTFCVAIWKRCYRTDQHFFWSVKEPWFKCICTSLISAQIFYYNGSKLLSYGKEMWQQKNVYYKAQPMTYSLPGVKLQTYAMHKRTRENYCSKLCISDSFISWWINTLASMGKIPA